MSEVNDLVMINLIRHRLTFKAQLIRNFETLGHRTIELFGEVALIRTLN